jgi:hypothetical protein
MALSLVRGRETLFDVYTTLLNGLLTHHAPRHTREGLGYIAS